ALRWFPRRYIDAANPVLVSRVPYGQEVAVEVEVVDIEQKRSGRGLRMLDVRCADASGELVARWFNQPYLVQKLVPGSRWTLVGTVVRYRGLSVMQSPLIENQPRFIPRYSQTKAVSTRFLETTIQRALANLSI